MTASGHKIVNFEWEKVRSKNAYYGTTVLLVVFNVVNMLSYSHFIHNGLDDLNSLMVTYINSECLSDGGIIRAINTLVDRNTKTALLFKEPLFFSFWTSILYVIVWQLLSLIVDRLRR